MPTPFRRLVLMSGLAAGAASVRIRSSQMASRRLRPRALIPAALVLPFFSGSALAADRPAPQVFMTDFYPEPLPLFLQGLQDATASKVDSKVETNSKISDEFRAVDLVKESNKVHFGLLSITSSFTDSKALFAGGAPNATRQDQTIAFDLAGLRNQAADRGSSLVWGLSPSSVYVNSFTKDTPYKTFSDTMDRTLGVSTGASWAWNGGNADVDYWSFSLDSRQLGQPDNSTGHGFDASIGTYVNEIGVYAGFSYYDAQEFASFYHATYRGQNTYASLSYKQQALPDIVIGGSVGRYDYNDLMYGFSDDTTYWKATLELDFSKFLWSSPGTKAKKSPTAKLFYSYYAPTDHSTLTNSPANIQFLGMMFQTALY
jgi:hypothetical protein